MEERLYFIYDGIPSFEKNIYIPKYERPSIQSPKEIVDEVEVIGKGTMYIHREEYYDINIVTNISFVCHKNEVKSRAREVRKWLIHGGKLSFSDDLSIFYKVKNIEISEMTDTYGMVATASVTFTCEPYEYWVSGEKEINAGTVLNTGFKSLPIYSIYGEGVANLTVNEKTMKLNVGQGTTIDVKRKIAIDLAGYNDNGIILEGDFDDLVLKPGTNNISITNGFSIKITPNWRNI